MEKDMKNDELLNNEEQNENIDNNVNEEAAEKEAAENVNADKEAEEQADKESDEQSTDDKAADAEDGDDQQPLDKALEKIAELQDKYLRSPRYSPDPVYQRELGCILVFTLMVIRFSVP